MGQIVIELSNRAVIRLFKAFSAPTFILYRFHVLRACLELVRGHNRHIKPRNVSKIETFYILLWFRAALFDPVRAYIIPGAGSGLGPLVRRFKAVIIPGWAFIRMEL